MFQSGNRTGTDLHLTVSQCRTVFHNEDFLALEEFGFVNREDGSSVDLLGRRVDFAQVGADSVDVVQRGGVDLVDDDDVSHAGDDLTRIVAHLGTGTQRVGNADGQIGNVEREVVVTAVPQHDVAAVGIVLGTSHLNPLAGLRIFGLATLQDSFVVDTSVDDVTFGDHVGFVLFHLLDGAVLVFEVIDASETLDDLLVQIGIVRHGVTHGDHSEAHSNEVFDDLTGGLRLTAAGTGGADGDDGLFGFHHGVLRAHEPEVGAGGVHDGADAHDVCIRLVAVGEHAVVNVEFLDQFGQFGLGIDADALRIEILAGEFLRIHAVVNAGDLLGGEGHHVVVLVVTEKGVEVVEVTTSSTDDDHISNFFSHKFFNFN